MFPSNEVCFKKMKGCSIMENLFDATNKAAYHIWEASKNENALNIWYCAEDLASWFEKNGILSRQDVQNIRSQGNDSYEYTNLIRNIAFRVYIYTTNNNQLDNWFTAEVLVNGWTWVDSITDMAKYYSESKESDDFIKSLKSDTVKDYYYPFSQQ